MNNIFAALQSEIPSLSEANVRCSFAELEIDSFDLVAIRGAVELALGAPIEDPIWTGFRSPADIIGIGASLRTLDSLSTSGPTTKRALSVGMPQMAVSGLSEAWLFKEVGDLHWQLITDGLRTPSSRLVDGNGDRLYATFTRVRMEHSTPLKSIHENDTLEIGGTLSRYGGGIFLSKIICSAGEAEINVTVASSFAKRGVSGSNQGLLKGQPAIPEGNDIELLLTKPEFIENYQRQRSLAFDSVIFECDYEINPYHDINGVGLLYFAAYPSIADTCELQYMKQGNSWAERSSTIFRDVFYFANSNANETLLYQIVGSRYNGGTIEIDALISRKNDGIPMAYITTKKVINA